MDRGVIRIRYQDFSAGTHDVTVTGLYGRAECRASGVTLYLLPGLSTAQRRVVIRRLRQEASRGLCPPLPQPQLAVALGLDRLRTAARIIGAVLRLHPALTLVPGAFVAAAVALFIMASSAGPDGMPKTRAGLTGAVPVGDGTFPDGQRTRPDGKCHPDGQSACCHATSCAVAPQTAHRPGPRDFAR